MINNTINHKEEVIKSFKDARVERLPSGYYTMYLNCENWKNNQYTYGTNGITEADTWEKTYNIIELAKKVNNHRKNREVYKDH